MSASRIVLAWQSKLLPAHGQRLASDVQILSPHRIMSHVYGSTATRTIPTMQARAQAARQRRREEDLGVQRLPGLESLEPAVSRASARYDHVSPWEPPVVRNDRLELDQEPDLDPDDIDPEGWADELDEEDDA